MRTAVKIGIVYEFFDDPLSIVVEQEAGVPCDSLKAVFAYREDFPDIDRIYLLDDDVYDVRTAVTKRDVLFAGIADEIVFDMDGKGKYITVYARSLACLLTDCECPMMTYHDPTLDVIAARHCEPFGLICSGSAVKERKGTLNIRKGSSHYKVLQRFCSEFLGTTPRVDHRGVIVTDMYSDDKTVCFDNDGGVPFGKISISDNRYGRITRIDVYDEKGYCASVKNPEITGADFQRVRCLNLPESSSGTLSDADRIIRSSNDKGFGITLESHVCLLNTLGYPASVNAPRCIGRKLYIGKIKYINDSSGERTSVKLVSRGED